MQKNLYRFFIFLLCLWVLYFQWPYLHTARMWPDEALYLWYAKYIAASWNNLFAPEVLQYHPPLYSLLLTTVYLFNPDPDFLRLVPLGANILCIILIYLVGCRVHSQLVGVLSAVLLAFNFSFLFYGTYFLIDVPLTAAILSLFWWLLKLNFPLDRSHSWLIGFGMSLIILLKWPGLLVIPVFIVYFFHLSKKISNKSILLLGRSLFLPIATVVIFLTLNAVQSHSNFPDISAMQGIYLKKPFYYYLMNMHNILILPYLIPFLGIGLVWIHLGGLRANALLIAWFWVFFIVLSIMPDKEFRYMMILFPCLALITALGFSVSVDFIFRKESIRYLAMLFLIVIVVLNSILLLPRTRSFIDDKNITFTGYKEAGAWLNLHRPKGAIVLAASRRQLRYYTGIDFTEWGGSMMTIPSERKQFIELIANIHQPLFLVIDDWEHSQQQPQWLFLALKQRSDLSSWGFRESREIEGEVSHSGITQKKTVIWIFERSKV